MNKNIIENIFIFKNSLFRPKAISIYKRLLKNDTLTYEELLAQNWEKRKQIVKHALDHTKFYKKRYSSIGSAKNTIETEKDFNKLPVLTRSDLNNHFSDIIADNVAKPNYVKATTSGSTGATISVLHDKRYPFAPMQWRVLRWWNIKPYENQAFIYRFPRTLSQKLINRILWWPTKRIFLARSEMDASHINKFIAKFNQIKPTLLQGYVDVVYEFALYLRDNRIEMHPPKAVWVTSAPLTVQQRQTMQEVFKAPVYDQYGSTEIMWLSSECTEQNGLHVMTDVRHIEIVDENNIPVPNNTWGKILVTDLHNYAFPLIRYEIGDYGRLLDRKCPCGIPLPLMDSVRGRQSDVVKTPSGKKLFGDFLTSIFDEYPNAIRDFQIVQAKDYSVKLFYVPVPDKDVAPIIASVKNKLDKELNAEIVTKPYMVDKIEQINGKTPFIISHIL